MRAQRNEGPECIRKPSSGLAPQKRLAAVSSPRRFCLADRQTHVQTYSASGGTWPDHRGGWRIQSAGKGELDVASLVGMYICISTAWTWIRASLISMGSSVCAGKSKRSHCARLYYRPTNNNNNLGSGQSEALRVKGELINVCIRMDTHRRSELGLARRCVYRTMGCPVRVLATGWSGT